MDVIDLTGPLPTGTTVLEASAGTGKTYTIAALATRYVAEGRARLPQLLILTFTRAATAELRERVRRRLVTTAAHLEAVLDGREPASSDPVAALLAAGDRDEVGARHRRLTDALAEFDAATISTIHGFCQHALQGLGLASDLERDAELVEDIRDLIEETVDDVLVRHFHDGSSQQLPRTKALAIGRKVIGNPTTRLLPVESDDPVASQRIALAHAVRADAEERKRRSRRLSYDDLLTRLRDAVLDPRRGAAVRATIRDRYSVALIDEFQDTDPVQWDILRETFERDGSTLVLIGDPKQAIYAFRGADVYSYLAAARSEHARHLTLGTNWRSDRPLLQALEALMDGATFGEPDIAFRPVAAAPGHGLPRLLDAPVDTPFRLRVVPRHPHFRQWKGLINATQARDHIAADVAGDIVGLLGSPAAILQRDADGGERSRAPVRPGDVAVLVRSNDEASRVHAALLRVNVPAIINGVGSVFTTLAASDWLRLLEAIERPAAGGRVRALALSAFIGWTGDEVAAADDEAWDDLYEAVHHWSEVVRDKDVTSLLRTVVLQRHVHARLLSRPEGERHVTDLEHLGELLHAAAAAEHLGPTALTSWLRARIDEARTAPDADEERLRRLESDDDAVQILTIHRSKGLQFPVVYVPYLWSSGGTDDDIHAFHDHDGVRAIDVGGVADAAAEAHKDRAQHEERGEVLRLLYVALTRAEHQVIAHYAPAGKPEWSSLGRMLLNRAVRDTPNTEVAASPLGDERILELCRGVATKSEATLAVETTPPTPSRDPWEPGGGAPPALSAADFDRDIDTSWRRNSYSSVTADPRATDLAPRVSTEPTASTRDDEAMSGPLPARPADGDAHLHAVPSAWSDLPGGAEVGVFVHAVLEHTDWAAADLDAELGTEVQRQLDRYQIDGATPAAWLAGLRPVIETPLGVLADDRTLRSFTRLDRRDEVEFELPLAGGADPTGEVAVHHIADLLRQHLTDDHPVAGYADDLPDWMLERDLRGYLTGSIDTVLRVDGRFLVVDHKTNRLAARDEPLTAWHYRPDALNDAMRHGHYPLQALLYSAALHRYLRWRLPDYNPTTHLGGVLYLFVRGMLGADAPADPPCGVFAWKPPAALVVALSDLLDGQVTT